MAQIVEAVRQKKLYVVSRQEKQLGRKSQGGKSQDGESRGGAVRNEPAKNKAVGGVWGMRKAYLAVAAVVAVVIDVLLIRYLKG